MSCRDLRFTQSHLDRHTSGELTVKTSFAGLVGAESRSAERTPSVRWALAGLALSVLLSSLGTSIANVALPSMAEAFNASFQAVQWVVIAYLLAITILIVSAGRLGDIVGRRRLLLVGISLFTLASVNADLKLTRLSGCCRFKTDTPLSH